MNWIASYPSSAVLDTNELLQYQKIVTFPKFSSVSIVQLNSLISSINEGGNLQLDLTGDDCEALEFEPKSSRYIDEQNYYYYGTLRDPNTDTSLCVCTCTEGEIMIESKDGRKYGYIVVDETKYELLALSESYSVLGKINAEFFTSKQECIVSTPTEGQGLKVPDIQLTPRTGGCAIRVLFLFTQAAEDAFGLGGINDMVNLAISQTNQAFSNSDIDNTCVIRANVREWVGFTEDPGNFEGDLFDLRTSNQVATWRATDLADVVILITDADYNGGILGGVPIENLSNPQEAFAFGVIEGNSITANFTFSHELGHIIGCRHQRCETFQRGGCDDSGPFEHGSGWGHRPCWLCSWKNYSTILHQLRQNNQRLLHYSNPDISLKGHPTGIIDSRDNARWIRDGHACIVAGYNPNPVIPLSAEINGDDILCRPLSGEYFVNVNGSNNPFSYDWRISTDGVNWGNSVGSGLSIWVNSNNYPLKSTVFLRVRVQDAIGNFVFAFFQISIRQKGTPGCNLQLLSGGGNGPTAIAYPNPVVEEFTIEFLISEDNTEAEFILANCNGNQIFCQTRNTTRVYTLKYLI
ncbi:MAG: hypothetical protein IPM34_14865 [Saprospiraceae bacterium]|nr:hypothetical protein [Saprospiraceae bacterium]